MFSLSSTPTTFFHFLSIIIACVVQGLAIVNFGILSIWVNSIAASSALIYHIIILFLNWRRNRVTSPTSLIDNAPSEKLMRRDSFPPDLKIPAYPSPAYSPPPYEPGKFVPNRRPSTSIVIPSSAKSFSKLIPSGPFYTLFSFCSIIGIMIITLMGFGTTVEVSLHGSKSLLPAERAKGMTFPWNMKIQKAQCTFLGVQLLLCFIVLFLCAKGRDEISRIEDEKREEAEYGFGSPRSPQTLDHWVQDDAV